jgi:N-acetylglucosaminyl-diphospho-decaprenol L-rhamnosyltransferase
LIPSPFGGALWPWRSSTQRPVGWAVGCAVVARTETLARLGPFDESIFLYGEDLELGLRAAREGVETWFWPEARVVHHGAHAARPAFGGEPFERLARARHEVVARRLGPGSAAVDDRAQAVTFGSRLLYKRALGLPATRERLQLRALRSVRSDGGRR